MLRSRVLTAALGGPLLLVAVWSLPTSAVAVVIAGLVGVASWEWLQLLGVGPAALRAGLTAAFLLSLLPGWLLLDSALDPAGLLYALASLWLGALAWLWRYARTDTLPVPAPGWGALVGWLVLWPCWLALVYLHGSTPWGAFWLTFVFALVWAADTGAYFVGRAWGRHRLAPRISPGKSWEGALGGAGCAVVVAAGLIAALRPAAPPLPAVAALAVLAVAASVVGDLFESMLKRQHGVKDSGGILPGHGGVLDRIDSLTAAAPVMAAGLAWWQNGT